MKTPFLFFLSWVAVVLSSRVEAQIYDTINIVVQTFAGSGFYGYFDGVAQQTMFSFPSAIVADSQRNLIILDNGNSRIRKLTPDGTVSTFAGGGTESTGVGTNVNLSVVYNVNYSGISIDPDDAIWLVASSSARLYKITSGALITFTNLPLSSPSGTCADSSGSIFISDWQANKIYRYARNTALTVFAGSGNRGYADGNGIFTAFASPTALAADAANNIYVWDSGNNLIRKIDQSRNVTTLTGKYRVTSDADGVGTNASFGIVGGMCVDNNGNLIVSCQSSVRRVSATTNVTTLAGSFSQTGYANGSGPAAKFWGPSGVCISQSMIFVADTYNQRVRNITFNPSLQPVSGANLVLNTYAGVSITGVVGRTYRVESSTDMSSWNTETTILLTLSPYLWIDESALGQKKLYRAILLP